MTPRNDSLSLLLSLLFFASTTGAGAAELTRRDLSGPELQVVRDAVAAKLREPDSAQIRNVVAADVPGNTVLCGEVNARNAAGGFSGFQRFYGNLGGKIVIAETTLDISLAKMFCAPITGQ